MASETNVIKALKSLEGRLSKSIEKAETGLAARIDAVETGLSARIDAVETGLSARIGAVATGLSARIGAVEANLSERLGQVETRVGAVETGLSGVERGLGNRIDNLAGALVRLSVRVDEVDSRLNGSIAELRLDMNGKFDAVLGWLERLQTEYHMLVVGMRRIEEQMAEDREDRERLKAQVTDLRERVKDLEAKLKELEARLTDESPAGSTQGRPS